MRFLIFFIVLFLSQRAYSIDIIIKTSLNQLPIENVEVFVYKSQDNLSKDKFFSYSKTDKEGKARFDLQEGRYFIVAEKELKDGFLFGYYGLNPLSVREPQTINVILVRYDKGYLKEIKEKKIEGIVHYDGKPLEDVGVYLYLDLSSELKGPPYLYAITDEKGYFSLDISEGSYYLIFRKRQTPTFGPPSSGDFVGFFPKFPIIINKKGLKIRANLFMIPEKRELSKNKNLFEIKGKVISKNGMPLERYYVGLYDNRELLGKPAYVSNPTDKEGSFYIYVKERANYFIGIRSKLGDTPNEDEKIFYYGELKISDFDGDLSYEIILD